jgi:acyl carrier protein
MTRTEIQSKVVEALREILRQSGCTDDPVAAPDTKPIGDLPGFDSLNGEEATVLLEAELGCELPQNVFIAECPRRALRVHETVDELCQRLGVHGEEAQT